VNELQQFNNSFDIFRAFPGVTVEANWLDGAGKLESCTGARESIGNLRNINLLSFMSGILT